jgi:hypothetical protein
MNDAATEKPKPAPLTPAAIELLDDAFARARRIRVRNAEDRVKRDLATEYRQGIMRAICAMTGMDMEELYDEFAGREIAAHEAAIAEEPMGWEDSPRD